MRTEAAAGPGRLRRYGAPALRGAVLAGAYYAAAQVGLLQDLVRHQVTPLWPPTGIALAGLLIAGVRIWPAIAVAAFAVNAPLGPSPLAVAVITAGNTLAPLTAYALLRRAGFRAGLDRLKDALALVFLGALAGMLVSASAGAAALVSAGALPAEDFASAWSVWWTGDAMGVLVVTPVLLAWRRMGRPRGVPAHRWLEGAALVAVTAAAALVATRSPVDLLFLVFPLLIWAAFRFQLAGAAPGALIVSVITVVAAAQGSGPFEGHGLAARMLVLQVFNGTVALTALLLASVVTERNTTHDALARYSAQLGELTSRLAPGTRLSGWLRHQRPETPPRTS